MVGIRIAWGFMSTMRAPDRDRRCARCLRALVLAFLFATIHPSVVVAADVAGSPVRDGHEVFAVDSPVGRIDYVTGRGLRMGNTGLTIGGFATAFAERLEDGEAAGGMDHLNFFVFYDPAPFLHFFSELEVHGLGQWEKGQEGLRVDPGLKAERLYFDAGWFDQANLRFGKFLTPFGRWNQVLAEPLLWTTSEPLIVEDVFSESVTGAMLWGTLFPRGGALSYSLYGTFLDPIQADQEDPSAKYNIGARLEWTSRGGSSVGASYLASNPSAGTWNHLGGVDGLWRPLDRVELSGEALFGEGPGADGWAWGCYVQAVVETVPTLYLVTRYERFDPPNDRGIDLFDLGLTWIPTYYLRFKADYQFADHADDPAEPGFRASFSVLF
jgi:hypothetical protein